MKLHLILKLSNNVSKLIFTIQFLLKSYMTDNILDNPIDEFYSKKLYFSYSALNRLLWNPKEYYNYYILNQKEEKVSGSLLQGKVIHCLLLNNNTFNDDFIISPANLPTGNNKLVIDRVFYHHVELLKGTLSDLDFHSDAREMYKLPDYNNAILDILKDINLHQSLKTDQQRLDKILTEENINYFEFLKNRGDKTLIDQETYDYCVSVTNVIKSNDYLMKLLGLDNESQLFSESLEVFNEIELKSDLKDYTFGIKGIIDNYSVNHDKKLILINDLKTTSKELKEFSDSVDFYKYWLQAIIYIYLVTDKHKDLIYNKNYNLEFRFIVINDKIQYYPFKVSDKTLSRWYEKTKEVFAIANYHYTNRKYELPYEFDLGIVEL